MNKKIFFEWADNTVIISIVFVIIFIAVLIYLFRAVSFSDPFTIWGGKVLIALLFIGVEIYFLSTTPLYLTYNEKQVCIKTVIGSIKFSNNEICKIEKIDLLVIANSTRKMGSGGAGGYTGLFYNSVLGNYYMYVTKKQNLVLLETKTKKYVFNCSQRDDLVSFIKDKYPLNCKQNN